MASRPVSFRLDDAVVEGLDRLSRTRGLTRNALAERLLSEGTKMSEHPGIVFRDGALGRRAALVGTRLDVWQVIGVLRDNANDIDAAARWLDLPPAGVRAAIGYYAANRGEIDDVGAREREAAEWARGRWLAEQSVLSE